MEAEPIDEGESEAGPATPLLRAQLELGTVDGDERELAGDANSVQPDQQENEKQTQNRADQFTSRSGAFDIRL